MTRRPFRAAAAALAAAALLAACAPSEAPRKSSSSGAAPAPSSDPLRPILVMSFNVGGFSADSPESVADTLAAAVASANPDILVLQGMGPGAVGSGGALDAFHAALVRAGLPPYPRFALFAVDGNTSHLAWLSRVPVSADITIGDDAYSIGPERFTVQHGFLDLLFAPERGRPFRLLAADLKSKEFHAYGQAEMRRNEARLLGNRVRAALRADSDARLVVLGTFNDAPDSAPLRAIRGDKEPALADVRPLDAFSHAWTALNPDDSCDRADYVLVSPALLPSVIPSLTSLVDSPSLSSATPHRPLLLALSP